MSDYDERIKELSAHIEEQRRHLQNLQVLREWEEKPESTVTITCTKAEVNITIGGYVCRLRETDKARYDFVRKVREYLEES